MIPVTLVVGNPKPNSRTRGVAVTATQALCRALAGAGVPVGPVTLIDLAEVTADLVGQGERPGALEQMLREVRVPGGLLVVASPTFKAAYTGLLKMFIDLLPKAALRGVIAVPLMTAASAGARTVVELLLRPLLLELGAQVPVPGLCVVECEFDMLSELLGEWVTTVLPALTQSLLQEVSPPPLLRSSAAAG